MPQRWGTTVPYSTLLTSSKGLTSLFHLTCVYHKWLTDWCPLTNLPASSSPYTCISHTLWNIQTVAIITYLIVFIREPYLQATKSHSRSGEAPRPRGSAPGRPAACPPEGTGPPHASACAPGTASCNVWKIKRTATLSLLMHNFCPQKHTG